MASTPGYFPATLSPSKEKKISHTSELIRLYLPPPLPSLLKALTLPPKTFCPTIITRGACSWAYVIQSPDTAVFTSI